MSDTKKLNETLRNRIPEALNVLGDPQHGDTIRAWILEQEGAEVGDWGMTPANDKYPEGRQRFLTTFTSVANQLKKKGVIHTAPKGLWAGFRGFYALDPACFSEGAPAPVTQKPKKAPKSEEYTLQETPEAPVEVIEPPVEASEVEIDPVEVVEATSEVEIDPAPEVSEAERLEAEQTQRNNAYMEEHGEDSLTPKGGEVEVYVNEDNIRIGVDAKGNEWHPREEVEVASEEVEVASEEVEVASEEVEVASEEVEVAPAEVEVAPAEVESASEEVESAPADDFNDALDGLFDEDGENDALNLLLSRIEDTPFYGALQDAQVFLSKDEKPEVIFSESPDTTWEFPSPKHELILRKAKTEGLSQYAKVITAVASKTEELNYHDGSNPLGCFGKGCAHGDWCYEKCPIGGICKTAQRVER